MNKYVTAVAAISLVALAGCGQTGGAKVASAGEPAASATPSASSQADGLKFAQCMRENGVDMPDPEPGGNNVMLRGKTDADTLKKASEACRKYNPVGSGKKMMNDPKTQDALLRFARCMRENGVDMKDPDFSGGAVRIGGEGMDPESPRTKKAIESCQEHLPGGLGKRP
ncbi:hypothetical protein OG339_10175 [Streptosporangium sp. NBC_01495]|uniref:hypothetical protein n=1 Tax=Streptosporangium sp. NBC_01495 TaxID=2903899 RepID=UPI002E315A4D|nr:hypothetical protein [Streptosporangium sp. NBC_01495]